jgi:hypothetical protein
VSAEFVASLRARQTTLRVGAEGGWLIRVEVPEVWDVVRIDVAPTESVRSVKAAAIGELVPDAGDVNEFVTKLNGIEVLDEDLPLSSVGAESGSTLLVMYRRRRPVR